MQLDKNYSIEKDENQYTLKYLGDFQIITKGKHKGKEFQTKRNWYYPNIVSALMGYLNERIDPNDKVAEQVLAQIEDVKQTIINALNK